MEGPLTPEQLDHIRSALLSRNKIEAIKLFREASGTGLVEAKQAVEDLERQWGLAKPSPAAGEESPLAAKRAGAGCMVMVAAGLLAAFLFTLTR